MTAAVRPTTIADAAPGARGGSPAACAAGAGRTPQSTGTAAEPAAEHAAQPGLLTRAWRATCSAVRSVGWYLGELMGDHDYAKYVAHLRAHHPDREVPSEKEFWRARWAAQDANPGARCC